MRGEKTISVILFFLTPFSRLFPGTFEGFLLKKKREGKANAFFYRGFFFFYDLHVALTLRKSGLFSKGVFRYTSPCFRQIQKESPLLPWAHRKIPFVSSLAKVLLSEAFFYARNGNGSDKDLLPGLAFTPERYLEEYPSVKESGINPLYHFITRGYREKKKPFSFLDVPLEKEAYIKKCSRMLEKLGVVELPEDSLLSHESSLAASSGDRRKIAVHLHLFYSGMFPLFLSFLEKIPFAFDLYFSLPEGTDGESYRAILAERLPRMRNYFWADVPNRGRDMAPLLCTFGEKLAAEYDIFCHLHTKKSPHNPGLRKWGLLLLQSLLGSEERIRRIAALLEKEAKIVYPAMAEDHEPDPLTFWSAAALLAEPLLQKVGKSVKDYPIIDYPHGNMFWARGEYLKPLLALGICYDDFPPEPIDEEGSFAHILEHTQLILARDVPGKAVCFRKRASDPLHKAPCL